MLMSFSDHRHSLTDCHMQENQKTGQGDTEAEQKKFDADFVITKDVKKVRERKKKLCHLQENMQTFS